LELVQLKPGKLRAVLMQADLGPSSIHWNRYGLPLRGRGSVSSEHWTMIWFPNEIAGNFNGIALNGCKLLAYPPGAEFEGTISGSCDSWVATVRFDELARSCEAISQRDFTTLPGSIAALRPDPRQLSKLQEFGTTTVMLAKESPHLLTDERTRQSLHGYFLDLLSHAIVSAVTDERPSRGKQQSHAQIVRRAEEFIGSVVDQPVCIADLCSKTGATERTLERAFQTVVGITPQTYLKAIRLKRARAQLERSPRGRTTVTSAALREGFFHLGRFSAEYRRFFGELPSDTLSRTLES
jgi:AraC family ethanolamine operon transcriptional activator